MALIPPETIEQILASNDIVEVIGAYFPLKRAAGVYKALCPFHVERTPSFSVNPKHQRYKCFGCGAGGSVVNFLMEYEKLDFVAALKKLAERAGIKIIEGEMSPEDSARYKMRRRLLALHAEAADFFHLQLTKKPSAQDARDYLKSRGITSAVAKAWKLGYAPDSFEAFAGFANQSGFSDEELVASGLVKLRDEENPRGQFYDRFRARVMFPICEDKNGEVIAFSGRVLQADAKAAKYLNSPETLLFKKGAVLFGLHRSKRALIDKESAIVCEGQLDLITAFEAGVQNVIAPQGTAFTAEQAHLLKRYVKEVVLCFDSDGAGEKATERSLEALLSNDLAIRVVGMPAGEDPDSMIRTKGAEEFLQRVEGAENFFEYQLTRQLSKPEYATIEGKAAAAEKLATMVKFLKDGFLKESVIGSVTTRLGLSREQFLKAVDASVKKPEAPDPRQNPSERSVEILQKSNSKRGEAWALERERVASGALTDPTLRLLAAVTLGDDDARAWVFEEPWNEVLAREPGADLLIKILQADMTPSNPASINAFLATLEAAEAAAVSAILGGRALVNALTIAHDCWKELDRRQTRRRIESIQAGLRLPDLPADEVLRRQKQILDLQKRLSDIARPFSPSP